jgi:hypothetical protein
MTSCGGGQTYEEVLALWWWQDDHDHHDRNSHLLAFNGFPDIMTL